MKKAFEQDHESSSSSYFHQNVSNDDEGNDHSEEEQVATSQSLLSEGNDNGGDDDYDDDDDDSSSSSVMNPNTTVDEVDAVALLKQIFPEESTEALRELHFQHVHGKKLKEGPKSNLGRRIFQQFAQQSTADQGSLQVEWKPVELEEDFLRLPTTVAVRRTQGQQTKYEFTSDLHQEAMQEFILVKQSRQELSSDPMIVEASSCATTISTSAWTELYFFSAVIHRHKSIGLGLSLVPQREDILVHSLVSHPDNPCIATEIRPSDTLIGINGSTFYFMVDGLSPNMTQVKEAIRSSPDPVVLHLARTIQHNKPDVERNSSLFDSSQNEEDNDNDNDNGNENNYYPLPLPMPERTTLLESDLMSVATTSTITTASSWGNSNVTLTTTSSPYRSVVQQKVHPFAQALARRGLIRGLPDEQRVTKRLRQFSTRATQWERFQSLRIDATTHQLLPREEGPLSIIQASGCAPSTPTKPEREDTATVKTPHSLPGRLGNYPGDASSRRNVPHKHPHHPHHPHHHGWNEVFLPLCNIRKALCARIVNTFLDQDGQTAYTIWVHDVETNKEWYSPIRYFQDFEDLNQACTTLSSRSIKLGDFPARNRWFGGRRSMEEETQLLERFLRNLCSLIYTSKTLCPELAEMAIHVQSFLGVEAGLADRTDWDSIAAPPSNLRQELKVAFQRYTYRIFLLNVMSAVVTNFVDVCRSKGPRLEDIESLQVQSTLQTRARADLERIQAFLDQLVDLIVDGCQEDLQSIARQDYYSPLHYHLFGQEDTSTWERLVREAVREQVEIEVYVPLRSVVSRLLVNGWRHEDMEFQFKIKELQKRPPNMFRVRSDIQWRTASTILKKGVGMSTLPCNKLKAIVEAAGEISRLHDGSNLSADNFLPIFIYCVVRADMDRPCALCVLLQTLCDKMNRIGEIGYFLASFEAAIAHISDLDLTEQGDDDLEDDQNSFFTEPLSEVSLQDD